MLVFLIKDIEKVVLPEPFGPAIINAFFYPTTLTPFGKFFKELD
mgnify:CR=1 FL=1